MAVADKQKTSLGPVGEALRHNIRRIREAHRLTYVELSERLAAAGRPIPVLGLRRVERGERRVDVDDLVALALVLDVSPALLLLPREEPHGDPSDPREHWVSLTGTTDVPWRTAWRWMHGEFPPADVTPREVREFRAENRPYEDENPVREAYEVLRARIEGAWDLEMHGEDDGTMTAKLTRRTERGV